MKTLIVNLKNNKPCKLSKYILDNFKNLSYSSLFKALRNKDIRINNVRCNNDILVNNNDTIDIYISDEILYGIPKKIDYYYIDENILIAYKKKGILSNNESNKKLNELTFEDIVINDFKNNQNYNKNDNIKICHRLDRNTDGLIIFSRNDKAHNEILNGFKNNYIQKEYIAYVYNSNFTKNTDTLTAYLEKDSKSSLVKIYETNKKNTEKIITSYSVLEKNSKLNYAKLNIILHTGKTHQIRAHLKFINHPIIGDSKYGINDINKKFNKQKQMLTAYKYSFNFDKNSLLNYLNDKIIEFKNIDTI